MQKEKATNIVFSSPLFIQAIEERQQELEIQKEFLQRALEDPRLLFVEAHAVLKSTKNMIFQVMNHFTYEDERMKVHDFQKYIGGLLNEFISGWAKENGLENVTADVRSHNTFPSIYAVYVDGFELIQFSILDKYYGHRTLRTEDDLINGYLEDRNSYLKEIAEYQKQIESLSSMKDNPYAHAKSLRDYWITFIGRAKLTKICESKIKNLTRAIETKTKELDERDKEHPDRLARERERIKMAKKLVVLFAECGYRLETKNHLLY